MNQILLSVTFSISALLGGQKSRVAFAKITFKKPHLLLLDEPSNHLVSLSLNTLFVNVLVYLEEHAFLCNKDVDGSYIR